MSTSTQESTTQCQSDNEPARNVEINTDGGLFIKGNIDTGGGDFVGRDKVINTTWPKVAIGAAGVALLAFTLLLIELVTNLIEQISGLSLQAFLTITGVSGLIALVLAVIILRSKQNIGTPLGYHNGDPKRPIYNQVQTFTGWYRRIAKITTYAIPLLVLVTMAAYYLWRILPTQQVTILVADFVAADGKDEARVTEIMVDQIDKTLVGLTGLGVKRLHQVIALEGGSEEAMRIGSLPQHKATVVIWGNYAVVAGDPEVHVHFDIVQTADTYLKAGFAASYGPSQISQLLQIEQPTMFDFKFPLGVYLGQMAAFTVGLTFFNANRHKDAIPFFEVAGRAIDQPLAAEFARAIRFFRGANYLPLGRAKDAKTDLAAFVPEIENQTVISDSLALAALGNLGNVAMEQGDYAAAKRYYEQALALYNELGHPLSQANQLGNLGNVAFQQGDYAAAKRYHEQALALDSELGHPLGQAANLSGLRNVAFQQGDYAAAKRYHEQALTLHSELGNPLGQAQDLGNLGSVARWQGDIATALTYLERSAELYRSMGLPVHSAVQADLDAIKEQ